MNKVKRKFRHASPLALLPVVLTAIFLFIIFLPHANNRFLAGLMPAETITPENLRSAYNVKKLRVLLVPGHDNTDYGTEFLGIREADLNRMVAKNLYDLLKKDGHFEVFTTRDFSSGDYTSVFTAYFANEAENIDSFRSKMWQMMMNALATGEVKKKDDGVIHNAAKDRVARKLYGINKWANENNIDIVLHLHFNDYAERIYDQVGEHSGFNIYVPEKQFSNSKASSALAGSIFNQMKAHLAVSTLPGESRGVTEDQKLIAVGANGSLDGAALLIEYGYIYEAQFTSPEFRRDMMKELAYQTYLGVKKYFEPRANLAETTLLPFDWRRPLKKGLRGGRDVLSLQFALHQNGVYPPPGKDLAECSITGNFGPCTEAAVSAFQEKYADEILTPVGLPRGTGYAGPATLRKLNELYGSGLSRGGN